MAVISVEIKIFVLFPLWWLLMSLISLKVRESERQRKRERESEKDIKREREREIKERE